MRTETRAVVRAALLADPTIPKASIPELIALLTAEPKRDELPDYLSVSEAAKVTSTSRWTVRRWIRAGNLKATRIAGVVRIPRASIHELLG